MNTNDMDYNERIHLIQQYELDMYRIARVYLRCEEDCKDALQEAIFKAYKNINQLKEPKYLKTWLIKITINECRRIYNKQKLYSYLSFTQQREDSYTMESDESLLIRQAIARLGEKHKIPIVLYYYNDCTYEEIAQVLRLPIGTVRSRLNKAKGLLKQMLEEEVYKDERVVRR